ncbi:hypothetical protein SAMN02799624_05451 [Paenibacillus sp. UNC496MF]|uniref:hypothetical protein n=1 Tax=Paenibacillus sp. UNC496MF TaxID=1502753 RepID=UPI0008F43AE2|nr:hypothetical protein [Paenibacillus sp. UNC496MF]SFJ67972.1 hypothetical protein SAMN02799624_05451 [Paenibacillus sp. UNC496MF]
MASLGLTILTVLIVIGLLLFYAGIYADFIRPRAVQVQLLGLQFTLFGIVLVLAFDDSIGYGVTIGLMGLLTGVVGSLQDGEKPAPREADR